MKTLFFLFFAKCFFIFISYKTLVYRQAWEIGRS
ncbi:hypothetical protein OIU84_029429 [Salix udensis]|uniref:Uncharacterized protein n=1 Tax=Salix udensis TaxID=889485 RepID=A0AAD6K995_9ROSI|nr:hypothetical protein OIU84_029429 [Salix udensis]